MENPKSKVGRSGLILGRRKKKSICPVQRGKGL